MPEPFDVALPGLDKPDTGVPVAPICRGHVQACASCGAPIVWAMTDNHRPMPVDPTATTAGNVRLTRTRGGLAATVTRDRAAGELLHLSHFATCPNAQKHRNPRRPPNGPTAR